MILLFRQDSLASDESSFAGVAEGGSEKINEFQAAWNVTNAIQGMFIVSLPFAVLRGGYWAIIAMVGIAHICCYTGKVFVEYFCSLIKTHLTIFSFFSIDLSSMPL